jgi:hypothetical protein
MACLSHRMASSGHSRLGYYRPQQATLAAQRSESNTRDSNKKRKHWAWTPTHVIQQFTHYAPFASNNPKERDKPLKWSPNSERMKVKSRAPGSSAIPPPQAPGQPRETFSYSLPLEVTRLGTGPAELQSLMLQHNALRPGLRPSWGHCLCCVSSNYRTIHWRH